MAVGDVVGLSRMGILLGSFRWMKAPSGAGNSAVATVTFLYQRVSVYQTCLACPRPWIQPQHCRGNKGSSGWREEKRIALFRAHFSGCPVLAPLYQFGNASGSWAAFAPFHRLDSSWALDLSDDSSHRQTLLGLELSGQHPSCLSDSVDFQPLG